MKCKDCQYIAISVARKNKHFCSNYQIKDLYVEPNDECHGTTSEDLP